jgi:hypothetical protein
MMARVWPGGVRLLLLAAGFAQHAADANVHEPFLQVPDRRLALSGAPPDLYRPDAIRAEQYHPRRAHMLLRAVPRHDNVLDPVTISRAKSDFYTCAHPPELAYPLARRNHSLVPIH